MNASDAKMTGDDVVGSVRTTHRDFEYFIRSALRRAWLLLAVSAIIRGVVCGAGVMVFLFATRSLSGMSVTAIAGTGTLIGVVVAVWTGVARRGSISDFVAVLDDHYDAAGRLVAAREFLMTPTSNDVFRSVALQDAARWVAERPHLGLPWVRPSRWRQASMTSVILVLVLIGGCAEPAARTQVEQTKPDLDEAPATFSRWKDSSPTDEHVPVEATEIKTRSGPQETPVTGRQPRVTGRHTGIGTGRARATAKQGDGTRNGADVGGGSGKRGDPPTGARQAKATPQEGAHRDGSLGMGVVEAKKTSRKRSGSRTSSGHPKATPPKDADVKRGPAVGRVGSTAKAEKKAQQQHHRRKISAPVKDIKANRKSDQDHSAPETSEGIGPGEEFLASKKNIPSSRPVNEPAYAPPEFDDLAIERIPSSRRALIKRYLENLRILSGRGSAEGGQTTSQPTTQRARSGKRP